MRISREMVIETACNIADEKGLHNVSLKVVAEKLGIRTPSLYNHIEGLDELLREVAHQGMRTMNERMMQAAVGRAGDEAIRCIAVEYLNFMIEHPGIYETIQWGTWNGTEKTAELFAEYTKLLGRIVRSCGCREEKTDEIVKLLSGILHGFTTLQLKNAFLEPDKTRNALCTAIDTVLLGIHQRYGEKA